MKIMAVQGAEMVLFFKTIPPICPILYEYSLNVEVKVVFIFWPLLESMAELCFEVYKESGQIGGSLNISDV